MRVGIGCKVLAVTLGAFSKTRSNGYFQQVPLAVVLGESDRLPVEFF